MKINIFCYVQSIKSIKIDIFITFIQVGNYLFKHKTHMVTRGNGCEGMKVTVTPSLTLKLPGTYAGMGESLTVTVA